MVLSHKCVIFARAYKDRKATYPRTGENHMLLHREIIGFYTLDFSRYDKFYGPLITLVDIFYDVGRLGACRTGIIFTEDFHIWYELGEDIVWLWNETICEICTYHGSYVIFPCIFVAYHNSGVCAKVWVDQMVWIPRENIYLNDALVSSWPSKIIIIQKSCWSKLDFHVVQF